MDVKDKINVDVIDKIPKEDIKIKIKDKDVKDCIPKEKHESIRYHFSNFFFLLFSYVYGFFAAIIKYFVRKISSEGLSELEICSKNKKIYILVMVLITISFLIIIYLIVKYFLKRINELKDKLKQHNIE